LSKETQARLNEEYVGEGPLRVLLEDNDITEVIINRFDSIWIEIRGKLVRSDDTFLSEHTYDNFLQRLYLEIGLEPTLPNPFIDSSWNGNRLHIIGTYSSDTPWVRITIRKHKKTNWSLNELQFRCWANPKEIQFLHQLVKARKNILVIGPTGSGKTSVLKAFLNECEPNERIVVLEDSREIDSPNLSSTHLLTRYDSRNIMSQISLTDLVRQSLRMRPDRIVVGEVRGGEAKDLLMALATGHEGSAGTLHAADAHQALIRLEMLVQMGASHWNLQSIRRLIHLSIDYLIVCCRNAGGERKLAGIHQLISIEESGIIIERIDIG
jgi:pilus assembly protein CpaF